jgi:MoxR-like ATPase
MIPSNITKEHIKKAISEISEKEIPPTRKEKKYVLHEDGKTLPIKYVISIANKFANLVELESEEFNAIETKKFLEEKGFNVVNTKENKSLQQLNFWIEKTNVNNRPDRLEGERALGKALWSPQTNTLGYDTYKNMREVKEGDIVLHLIDNKYFSGASIVRKSFIEADGVKGTKWEGPCYLISLKDYTELKPKIKREEILNNENKKMLDEIALQSEVFYNKNLNLREGAYLTPCPSMLGSLINSIYRKKSGDNLPHFPNTIKTEGKFFFNAPFKQDVFIENLNYSGLLFSNFLIVRFLGALLTKPFVILTGLSGSGKTKLAQAFVQWICQDESQYKIVPVGADWTNREPLLGYPNALNPEEYIKPDSGVLDLIIEAAKEKNQDKPHFLILDEMNLSQVERYFADFLSVMESGEDIPLFAEGTVENGVPAKLRLPSNLFVIGTVNIDETTNMFSPKVLDRANTIEFRVMKDEMENFLKNMSKINMDALVSKGAGMAKDFLRLASNQSFETKDIEEIRETLLKFFVELKKTGAEFGYRSASEILRLIHQLSVLDKNITTDEKLDIAIMHKLLPKLHGSRRKLCPVLSRLGSFCIDGDMKIEKDVFENPDFDFEGNNVLYPLSLEKIARMHRGAVENGYSSFAEA